MFVRAKKSGQHQYLQLVQNDRVGGKVKQRVIATLGRLDQLQDSGQIERLALSCAKFVEALGVIRASERGEIMPTRKVRIGPNLVFAKLWREMGIDATLKHFLADRKYEFEAERAVFLTVLHRLFDPGSDRAAEEWRKRYSIPGAEDLELHHLYRAMAWLGEPLDTESQRGATGIAPLCVKDLIEERLFRRRRDLFSNLQLVFLDTTSLYFEGNGGETLGRKGHSKDHRPNHAQMVVGVVIDNDGRPICCEMWPGNTSDAKIMIPVMRRLKSRFDIGAVCVVADRGLISKSNIEELRQVDPNIRYILGARLRAVKEIREQVLSNRGRWIEVRGPRSKSGDPSPLKVKDVHLGDRRYVVCLNEEGAVRDKETRAALIAGLQDKLRTGAGRSALASGRRSKYLKTEASGRLSIDYEKVKAEARFDGKWVLQTDTALEASAVAGKYMELWTIERVFRTLKNVLEVRPIYHRNDDSIRGHVFRGFLALMLLKELSDRLKARNVQAEWSCLRADLDSLEEITIESEGKSFVIRSAAEGQAGQAIQAVGACLGPSVRILTP